MYEYRVIHGYEDYTEERLNKLAEEGYEFVSLSAGDYRITIVMKRKKVVH